MKKILQGMLILAFIFAFAIGGYTLWLVGKKVNYSLSYKSMVEQTVRDMVKKECLNEKD